MKTLLTRSLSGVVFAAIMLLGFWHSRVSFIALLFVINLGCLWEYYTITRPLYAIGRVSTKAYRIAGLVLGTLVFAFFAAHSLWWLPLETSVLFVPLLYVFAALELRSLSPQAVRNASLNVFGLVYISATLGLLLLLTQRESFYEDRVDWFPFRVAPVLGLLLLVWANDTFAYLGGSLFGRTKLYAEISPGKTWEGFATGVVFALAASYGLYLWLGVYSLRVWLGLALIASCVGAVGDLFESMIKRNVGIKDSGRIMPGHGGFLDRFDAFLFCAPFAWAWIRLST
ncbi:MAG TPA: phosphatidate cytidylyltransferase [Chitinophagales bacterium]|nr:phosphatidate cytidylyltransferase [Chitinophagales bacterium]